MNYPEELRERYNEVMFDERDIIEKFLRDQYDLRYGHQRDEWSFEHAIEVVSINGSLVLVHGVKLDENKSVVFDVEAFCEKSVIWECTDFAYGELSKVIEALPNADEIVKKNAIDDIATELELSGNIVWSTGQKHIIGDGFDVLMVTGKGSDAEVILRKFGVNSEPIMLKNLSTIELKQLRDHINLCNLHKDNEYKKLVKFLSEQPNLCFEPADWGHVMFTIHGTDVKVDVLSASLDANGRLQLCVDDDNKEAIYLEEKDIRPEYLVDLVGYIEDHCYYDIIDKYNGHNEGLVYKINDAWKNKNYNERFGAILLALLTRDKDEFEAKYDYDIELTEEFVYTHAHEIMEGVCDDLDLQMILLFIRYK